MLLLVHLWTGLIVGAYAVVIGLTGAALTFRAELQARAYPQFFGGPPAGGPLADPTVVVGQLRQQYPGHRFSGITYPTPTRHTFLAYLSRDGVLETVFSDPHSGLVLGELPGTAGYSAYRTCTSRCSSAARGTSSAAWGRRC